MSYEDYYSPSTQSITAPKVNGQLDFAIQKVKKVSNSPFQLFSAPLDYYYDSIAKSGDQLPWGVASVWANGESSGTVDWTGTADATIAGNYDWLSAGDSLLTAAGEYEGIDAGISKFLLSNPLATKAAGYTATTATATGDKNGDGVVDAGEGWTGYNAAGKIIDNQGNANAADDTLETGAAPYVDAFAIVIDSGVAKLDDFNIGAISEDLSMSFVDTDFDSFLFDEKNNAFVDGMGHGTHVAGTIAA